MRYIKKPAFRRLYSNNAGQTAALSAAAVRRLLIISLLSLGAVGAFLLFSFANPSIGYFEAAQVKLAFFLLAMFGACLLDPSTDFLNRSFKAPRGLRELRPGLVYGSLSFIVILGFVFIAMTLFNVDSITGAIVRNNPMNTNYVSMMLYVVAANTALEELFFRGFAFIGIAETGQRLPAYIFSSALFAVYHLYQFDTGFPALLIILAMAGLFLLGMIYCRINENSGSIFNSWIAHTIASAAITLAGLYINGYIQF